MRKMQGMRGVIGMTKDEMKDEMKNKISMALKDAVLQQGFEIICKNLAELEKENAELKEKISILLSCRNCPENKGGLLCEKEYEGRCLSQKVMFIKELKEEIAELKKQLEMSNKVYNDNLDYSYHIEGQLTKAKELLAKWVELFKPKSGNIPPTPVQVETEQFLNEARAMEGSK